MKRATTFGWGLACVLATAAPASAGWVWSDGRQIELIYPQDGGFVVQLAGAEINTASSCPNWFIVAATDPNAEAKVSTLITAYSRRDLVELVYDDESSSCFVPVDRLIAYPYVEQSQMQLVSSGASSSSLTSTGPNSGSTPRAPQ